LKWQTNLLSVNNIKQKSRSPTIAKSVSDKLYGKTPTNYYKNQVLGALTGHTLSAGGCLATYYVDPENGEKLIIVIMGSKSQ
jgi:D-alanyl-D-alanine carboxypeptidase